MSAETPVEETITISDGRLQGLHLAESGTLAWLGIPYAMPPVGKLRWKAPRAAGPWSGILPVRDFNNSSMQLMDGVPGGSEDCLYLNIWRPDHKETGLPVFVYLHGGGNISGSGRDFAGEKLARETDAIIITVNYRLGALGFFRHPALRTGDPLDDLGNYGLLDILHALKWVHKNIHYFGGNPGNITLAGQSAGARNALAAYLSPLGKGLFHKLYIMSGGLTTAPAEDGDAKANDMLKALLVQTGKVSSQEAATEWIARQSLEAVSDYLYSTQAERFAGLIRDTGLRMAAFPHLFEDGTVLPEGGFDNLHKHSHEGLPVVLGSTASEFSGFALGDSLFSDHVHNGKLTDNMEHKLLFAAASQYGDELYASFNAEQTAVRLTAVNPEIPVFAYRFRWGLHDGVTAPVVRFLLGAPHGADVPFYTGKYDGNYAEGVISADNEPGRSKLSSLMCQYLRHFIYTGDPNAEGLPRWRRFTGNPEYAEILSLDATEEQAVVQGEPKLFRQGILSRMMEDSRLTGEQRSWLTGQLFADRFFWKDKTG
ncbi:hypothetical protein C2I18_07255 [Paenibacillus sp. PK3_47]|uniref:carboxylesterase/lipase family protein n=1 Tax=Paenibacillus sp. PK3_47 TaxID=2072642 RepID=UPI00201DF80E|nr:carboxylesterase family protein [Paenibacillus sp. PK3_47]UQZ33374.1 hypothetical protein C2I18_07255 [Paenibacillus sp. PK3_47]